MGFQTIIVSYTQLSLRGLGSTQWSFLRWHRSTRRRLVSLVIVDVEEHPEVCSLSSWGISSSSRLIKYLSRYSSSRSWTNFLSSSSRGSIPDRLVCARIVAKSDQPILVPDWGDDTSWYSIPPLRDIMMGKRLLHLFPIIVGQSSYSSSETSSPPKTASVSERRRFSSSLSSIWPFSSKYRAA